MVFNATFNNISVISWRSVLLVEETGGPGENHRPGASHCQTLSHNVVSSTPYMIVLRKHNVSSTMYFNHFINAIVKLGNNCFKNYPIKMLHQYDSFPLFLRQFFKIYYNDFLRFTSYVTLLPIINDNIFRTNSSNTNK